MRAAPQVDVDARQRLVQPETYSHADRPCDVVMKGGITSGIVYPLAICEMATRFHLKSVGGTSAGAIAAALAAAAQYGRLSGENSPEQGFPGLSHIPDELASRNALLRLFEPNRRTKRAHGLVMSILRRREGPGKYLVRIVTVLWQLILVAGSSSRFWIPLVGVVPGILVLRLLEWPPTAFWGVGALLLASCVVIATGVAEARRNSPVFGIVSMAIGVAVLVMLNISVLPEQALAWGFAAAWLLLSLGGMAGLLIAAWLVTMRSLTSNAYGLTTGYTSHKDDGTSLVEWLSDKLDLLAGLDRADGPLTFGHLLKGPSTASDLEHAGVNLEMLTTCLTQGRPYRLPGELGRDFYFDPEEMKRFFPRHIVEHMVRTTAPSEQPIPRGNTMLYPLPPADDLPVIVATRMSLSFPGLISAVPLYAHDHSNYVDAAEKPTTKDKAVPRVCWFSDGGITSNFPVSFFDRRLPRWPTFGINLREFHARRPQSPDESLNVYVPRTNGEGLIEWWTTWDRDRSNSVRPFASSIMDTMQNWVDNEQIRVPGFRDRIAHVNHNKTEGGLNLDMPASVILALSERGRIAGARLARYYSIDPEQDSEADDVDAQGKPRRVVGWRNHRWIRLRTTLGLLEEELLQLLESYLGTEAPYRGDLERSLEGCPSYKWTSKAQGELAIAMMDGTTDPAREGLIALAAWLEAAVRAPDPSDSGLRKGSPSPQPELRVMPRHERHNGPTSVPREA